MISHEFSSSTSCVQQRRRIYVRARAKVIDRARLFKFASQQHTFHSYKVTSLVVIVAMTTSPSPFRSQCIRDGGSLRIYLQAFFLFGTLFYCVADKVVMIWRQRKVKHQCSSGNTRWSRTNWTNRSRCLFRIVYRYTYVRHNDMPMYSPPFDKLWRHIL